MAQSQDKINGKKYQQILLDDPDFLQGIVTNLLQKIIDSEFTECVGADRYERTPDRTGYRNGSYKRSLKTRVGGIELSIPRDRDGTFQPSLFARFQRNEKALLLSLMEMTLEGVSTRKVSRITEQLCGTTFSKSLVSSLSSDLDEQLSAWRNRPLSGTWPYLYVDALYEKVRHAGRVRSMAVLIVVGVKETGHRSVLAVEVCNSENEADYGDLFSDLIVRGLTGVKLVISDDHKGLVNAINRHFQGSVRQRCQVHFMRNLLRRLRKSDRSWVMSAMKDIFNAPDRADADRRIRNFYEKLDGKYSDLVDWLEENINETLTVYDFPPAHHKRIRSTNGIERLNEEIRRRTRVIRIFPNIQSCLRMASALCQEQDEEWSTGKRYLDMTLMPWIKGVETEDIVRRAV